MVLGSLILVSLLFFFFFSALSPSENGNRVCSRASELAYPSYPDLLRCWRKRPYLTRGYWYLRCPAGRDLLLVFHKVTWLSPRNDAIDFSLGVGTTKRDRGAVCADSGPLCGRALGAFALDRHGRLAAEDSYHLVNKKRLT